MTEDHYKQYVKYQNRMQLLFVAGLVVCCLLILAVFIYLAINS